MAENRDDQWELNHLHTLIYDEIGMCGCGWADDAYTLVRDLLDHFHDRDERNIVEMVGSTAAAQIVLYRLQDADLLDHGTSVTSSWITDKGRYARWLMHKHPSLVEYAGYPDCWDHERDRCPDECWTAPAEVPPQPPGPTVAQISERIEAEAAEARARMDPLQRAVWDQASAAMENLLLYGTTTPPAGAPGDYVGILGVPMTGGYVDWEKMTDAVRAGSEPLISPYRDAQRARRSEARRPELDRLPSHGRNTRIGCQQYDSATWIHGRPHNCPQWARR